MKTVKPWLVLGLVVLGLLFLAWWLTASPHACCLVPTVSAQDEGEGNPGHVEPSAHCSHSPKAGQVGCKCSMSKCHPNEDRRCKSFCWKYWCTCKDDDCE